MRATPARVGIKGRNRAGRHAGSWRIRSRSQHDGNTGAENDAGTISLGEIGEIFGKHVPRFEIRYHQDLGPARDFAILFP